MTTPFTTDVTGVADMTTPFTADMTTQADMTTPFTTDMTTPSVEQAGASEIDDIFGLEAPTLHSVAAVTGESKGRHRIENKQRRQQKQAEQGTVHYWETHRGQFIVPPAKAAQTEYKGSMRPAGLALEHPAAETLFKYASVAGVAYFLSDDAL